MTKVSKNLKSGTFSHFFHFFTVFTGIFLVMTILILQIMKFGVYSSADSSLKSVSNNATDYAEKTMERMISLYGSSDKPNTSSNEKAKPLNDLTANMDIVLFSKDGTVLNPFDTFSAFHSFSLHRRVLNEIVTTSSTNLYGHEETYHTITLKIKSPNYPEIAYMMVVVNVEQLEEANTRYEKIIIIIMVIFWLISIGASIYLANWSRKPILESYEKQKEFVENASHELRTPLAVLQNRLESLFRKPETTIIDNSESIASSLEEVRNMRILTTNLLNLARRDDGLKPELAQINPTFFDDIFKNYELIAEDNGKHLTVTNLLSKSIKSDKTLLKQLMTILFDNAMKYTEEDGHISITIDASDKLFYFTIKDDGPGINEADKKKIFDRFYRVDKARTRQKGGFGLGLSLAYQIVESLKGTIEVKDNKPKGTVFEVRI
ncbi:sensor histidine kinase [Streptococcus urinalis]|uniref:sensor histidine kinase n=1 Tax=Streptococcus urinalis TaxID=149016 RepID=UPI0022AC1CFE|nr:HAMP domain-containing sensor histidine kinase [Streptococcus urinalis]